MPEGSGPCVVTWKNSPGHLQAEPLSHRAERRGDALGSHRYVRWSEGSQTDQVEGVQRCDQSQYLMGREENRYTDTVTHSTALNVAADRY